MELMFEVSLPLFTEGRPFRTRNGIDFFSRDLRERSTRSIPGCGQ